MNRHVLVTCLIAVLALLWAGIALSTDKLPARTLKGGTDNTRIGNVGDRMKVDCLQSTSGVPNNAIPATYRLEDMNASTGGVARDTLISTTFVKVYEYTGDGLLFGMVLNLEGLTQGWHIRLVIDSQEIFSASGVSTLDMQDSDIYKLVRDNPSITLDGTGLSNDNNTVQWSTPTGHSIYFAQHVKVYVKKTTGGDKKWRAGLISIVKDI